MAQGNAKKIGLDHGELKGNSDDDHPQYLRHSQAVADEDGTNQTVTSSPTSYSAGSPVVGVSFTAPPSGQVWVNLYGFFQLEVSTNNFRRILLSFEVREGSSIGSGTVVETTSDVQSVSAGAGDNGGTATLTSGARFLVSGLTPGDSYNTRTMHRINNTGFTSAIIIHRRIVVEPA